ncbi:hypothetical protein KQE47_26675, partial [Raoultella planticola]|uniref:hypothetical protein n=1 Tax=Raoultella planticola TaxID=575 RepID=UPI002481139B
RSPVGAVRCGSPALRAGPECDRRGSAAADAGDCQARPGRVAGALGSVFRRSVVRAAVDGGVPGWLARATVSFVVFAA